MTTRSSSAQAMSLIIQQPDVYPLITAQNAAAEVERNELRSGAGLADGPILIPQQLAGCSNWDPIQECRFRPLFPSEVPISMERACLLQHRAVS